MSGSVSIMSLNPASLAMQHCCLPKLLGICKSRPAVSTQTACNYAVLRRWDRYSQAVGTICVRLGKWGGRAAPGEPRWTEGRQKSAMSLSVGPDRDVECDQYDLISRETLGDPGGCLAGLARKQATRGSDGIAKNISSHLGSTWFSVVCGQ